VTVKKIDIFNAEVSQLTVALLQFIHNLEPEDTPSLDEFLRHRPGEGVSNVCTSNTARITDGYISKMPDNLTTKFEFKITTGAKSIF
jgi:hypothetical protein